MRNNWFTYLVLLSLLGAVSCAQVRSIPGGQKDLTPPTVLMAYPAPFTTHFNSRSIELVFDEYVQLNDINQELVVSPPLRSAPKIRVKQKTVMINIREELLPNTTYMFNFGDGVVDVNELNKAQDLYYVFSTGDVIDSLSISGSVKDVLADTPGSNLKVLLFDSDSSIFSKKLLPVYFTRSKSDGSFKLPYLRSGSFYIYALDDANSNYHWDDGESIAFIDVPVDPLLADSAGIELRTSIPRSEKPVINDFAVDSIGRISFALDPVFKDITITSRNGFEVVQYAERDSIFAWIKGKPTNKKEEIIVSWKDALSDTLEIPFYEAPTLVPFRLSTTTDKKTKPKGEVTIASETLFSVADTSMITVMQDSVLIPFNTGKRERGNVFALRFNMLPGKKYDVNILSGALMNDASTKNDTLNFQFTTFKTEELGELVFMLKNISSQSPHFILEDNNGIIVFEKSFITPGELRINNLPAGDYSAKILDDENFNGVFDPADPKKKIQPERVHVYPGKINVRSNWEVKLDWELK